MHCCHLLLGLAVLILAVPAQVVQATASVENADRQSEAAKPTAATDGNSSALAEGKALVEQGKYDEAIQKLTVAASANPEAKGVQRELALAYYRKADFPK